MTNRFKPELMSQLPNHTPARHQQGVVLLLMLVVLVLAGSAFLLTGLNQTSSRLQQNQQTSATLAEAKKALLAHTIYLGLKDSDDPGYYSLPCPDIDTSGFTEEGSAHGTCTTGLGKTAVGRLPWRSLGLPPLRDSNGECLWYVLSGNQNRSKINNIGSMQNPDAKGQLEIRSLTDRILAGANPQERAVAAIIAPGSALDGQSRISLSNDVDHCGGNYSANNYLDSANGIDNASPPAIADAITQLVTTHSPDGAFNDQITWITQKELADAFDKKKTSSQFDTKINELLKEVAKCLVNYDSSSTNLLPWAAPIDLDDYRTESDYDDLENSHFGRLPLKTGTSQGNGSTNGITLPDTLIPPPPKEEEDPPEYCFPTPAPTNIEIEARNYLNNWKDHLFYVVAGEHTPDQTAANCIGNCLQVNGAGDYPAIIIFAGSKIESGPLSQIRNDGLPTGELDTKQTLSNYLEGSNLTNFPDSSGNQNYGVATDNDIIFCIKTSDLDGGGTPDGLCD